MDESIFFNDFDVKINEVDANNRLKLNALLNYLQESAWANAGVLGFSTYDLMARNITWFMNRMKVKVSGCPGHLERITVETWPSGIDKYFVYRDYRVRNKQGEVLAEATSTWLVVDLTTRKLVGVPESISKSNLYFDRGNMPRARGKVSYDDQKTEYHWPMTTSWFDLDINNHINNSNYFKWFIDALPTDLTKESYPSDIDISFLSEGHNDENLEVESYLESEGVYRQRIINATKSKTLCSAVLTFNNF